MNTLGKILKQDLAVAKAMTKLRELEKQYAEEERKYQRNDIVLGKIATFNKSRKCKIESVYYIRDGAIGYVVNIFKENGEVVKLSNGIPSKFNWQKKI